MQISVIELQGLPARSWRQCCSGSIRCTAAYIHCFCGLIGWCRCGTFAAVTDEADGPEATRTQGISAARALWLGIALVVGSLAVGCLAFVNDDFHAAFQHLARYKLLYSVTAVGIWYVAKFCWDAARRGT